MSPRREGPGDTGRWLTALHTLAVMEAPKRGQLVSILKEEPRVIRGVVERLWR